MGTKRGKKRSLPSGSTSRNDLFLLTGVGGENRVESSSLESCLQDLQRERAGISSISEAASEPSDSMDRFHGPKKNTNGKRELKDSLLTTCHSQKVSEWESRFLLWSKDGKYTPGLLPSLDVELARHFAVQDLSKWFLRATPGLKMPSFERWLLDSKLQEKLSTHKGTALHIDDPVLASSVTVESPASKRLVAEVVSSTTPSIAEEDAIRLVRNLCSRLTQQAIPRIQETQQRVATQVPLKHEKIKVEPRGVSQISSATSTSSMLEISIHRKRWKQPFFFHLNQHHYRKLQAQFRRVHAPSISQHVFHYLCSVVLLRYSSLSGGQLLKDLRGGGMQGAVHEQVFAVLQKRQSAVVTECFASPWNATQENYFSAFYHDVDWHFGSIGDFFGSEYAFQSQLKNCLELNPPFAPGVMNAMVDQLERIFLQQRQSQGQGSTSTTAVVVIPTVHEHFVHSSKGKKNPPSAPAARFAASSFSRLFKSPFYRHHFVLPARQHGYVEGAQHLRPTRYKESSYDTSIFLLGQVNDSPAAWEQDLRVAFASRHGQELQERRRQECAI